MRLFRLLSTHPAGYFDVPTAAALAATDSRQARHLLGTLVRANLVQEIGRDRYRMPDLLHAYAAALHDEPATLVPNR